MTTMLATDAPARPALRYYGGKWNLADWIIRHFPTHQHYVEPCFGAGSVLLKKPPVILETVSDLDGRLVNYFRVLRDRPGELIRLIELTPWAQDEYRLSQIASDDPLEDARRFHAQCWMSIHGGGAAMGMRWQKSVESRYATPATDLIRHDLWTVAERLRRVQIMSMDALELIARLVDSADALVYFDPPYPKSERSHQNGYTVEQEDDFHVEAADLLRQCAGYVVVSGYACTLYASLYEEHGWHRVERLALNNSGNKHVESLWLNPAVVAALERETATQMRLL